MMQSTVNLGRPRNLPAKRPWLTRGQAGKSGDFSFFSGVSLIGNQKSTHSVARSPGWYSFVGEKGKDGSWKLEARSVDGKEGEGWR